MTDDELYEAIQADRSAKAFAGSGAYADCATAVAATLPPVLVDVYIDRRGIYAAFGPTDGLSIVGGIKAAAASESPFAPVIAEALTWLSPAEGGVNLGHPGTRAMLDALAAAGAITSDHAADLKALAERPATVTHEQVSRAMGPRRSKE